jgi:hypothetical protein
MIHNKHIKAVIDYEPPIETVKGNFGCVPYETAELSGERLKCGCIDQTKYTNE